MQLKSEIGKYRNVLFQVSSYKIDDCHALLLIAMIVEKWQQTVQMQQILATYVMAKCHGVYGNIHGYVCHSKMSGNVVVKITYMCHDICG